jgi:hypothetical protein
MEKIYFLGTLVFLAIIMAMVSVQTQVAFPTVQGLIYGSEVCIYKNNELVQCKPNILCNGGKDFIRDCLGTAACGTTPGNFTWIALGNVTGTEAQGAGNTTLENEWTSCDLTRMDGAYTQIGTGNWSLSHVWTASGTCMVNSTGLFNASSGDTLFAQNNFSTVNLQNQDQINVTWTIWVT